jgi:tetratricopeptide (TPR) repeat protein
MKLMDSHFPHNATQTTRAARAADALATTHAVHTAPAPSRVNRHDERGCPVDTRSADALSQFETAMWRMVSYYGDPIAALDQALAADPDWALAYIAKANCLLTMNEPRFADAARQYVEQAHARAFDSSRRERMHLAATSACVDGHWHEAVRLWEGILNEYPRDILALACAHLFDFYRGDALNLRRRVMRVLPDWSPGTPLRSYVMGMLAFGFEECNMYAMAEEAAEQALAIEPRDPWSVHALTHVYEMQGRHVTGEQFLNGTRRVWAPENNFAFHNHWHLGLFKLERLDLTGALEIYDSQCVVSGDDIALQRVDATALLLRLQLLGANVGDRWTAVSSSWLTQSQDVGFYAFNDVHAYIAHRAAGNDVAAAMLVTATTNLTTVSSNHCMNRSVGVPLLRGFAAYFDGRFAQAVDELYAVRDSAHRFGGSHAQRDIIDQTLLASAIASGQSHLAQCLINERSMAKPITPLTAHWQASVAARQ